MPLSSSTAAYTLIGMAGKFQDFFYNSARDVTFSYKDGNGNIQTKTVPNVAKVTQQLLANGVTDAELNTALGSYYTKSGSDGLITSLRNEVNGNINTAKNEAIASSNAYADKNSSIMSKAEFEAKCEVNRNHFAGSGQYSSNGSFYNLIQNGGTFGINFMFHNFTYYNSLKGKYVQGEYIPGQLAFPLDEGHFTDRKYKQMFNINGISILLYGTGFGRQKTTANNINFGIDFPDVNMPLVITGSNNPPALKQGDKAILADVNRELWNVNFDQANYAENAATIVDNVDGTYTYNVNGETSNRAWYFINGANKFESFSNIEYTLTFNYDNTIYTGGIGIGGYIPNIRITVKDGLVTVKFTGGDIYMSIVGDSGSTQNINISNFSLKQSKIQPITIFNDNTTADMYTQAGNFQATDSISRTDLMFLETWHEDVSEKGMVYPLGNTQYRGGITDGIPGITEGTFAGKETYSNFGNWQPDNALVGLGYVWDNLSDTDKAKFAGNPLNNIYKDGTNITQVRYRVRVVKGLGNNDVVDTQNPNYYGLLHNAGSIAVKGSYTLNSDFYYHSGNLPFNRNKYINQASGYNEYPTKQNGEYGADVYNAGYKEIALPLMLVQRRNPGIHHPKYNPDGCAKIYYNNTDKYFYEVPINTITSVLDCFNKDIIACRNDADGGVITLTALEADANNTTHFITGTVRSGVSGRID